MIDPGTRQSFYQHHAQKPRETWKATNPQVAVGIDLKSADPDPDACTACQGKGWQWKPKRPGKGVALVLAKCQTCNGTGK